MHTTYTHTTLRIFERVFGAKHKFVSSAYLNLGVAYESICKPNEIREGVDMLRKAIKIQRYVEGGDAFIQGILSADTGRRHSSKVVHRHSIIYSKFNLRNIFLIQ